MSLGDNRPLYADDVINAIPDADILRVDDADVFNALEAGDEDEQAFALQLRDAMEKVRWSGFETLGRLQEMGVAEAAILSSELASLDTANPLNADMSEVAFRYEAKVEKDDDPEIKATDERLAALAHTVSVITGVQVAADGMPQDEHRRILVEHARYTVEKAKPVLAQETYDALGRVIEDMF